MKIYTDGSTYSNGSVNSTGGIGVFFGSGDIRNISESYRLNDIKETCTNNRCELYAILRALDVCENIDENLIIYSDSKYCINCCSIWYKKWVTNNWRSNNKEQVKNRDLIEKILKSIKKHRDKYDKSVEFKHINSHKSSPSKDSDEIYENWFGNDQADMLARNGNNPLSL